MSDFSEILFYIFSFWRFILNKKFRIEWINNFKNGTAIDKFFSIIEATISIGVSFIIPIVIAGLVYDKISFSLKVDKCLDAGGSYNYSTCSCDYDNSHEYSSKHQCE